MMIPRPTRTSVLAICIVSLFVCLAEAQKDDLPIIRPAIKQDDVPIIRPKPKPVPAQLSVTCDLDCAWFVNGTRQVQILAGQSAQVTEIPGKYWVDAKTLDGLDTDSQIITLAPAEHKSMQLKLHPARSARLAAQETKRAADEEEQRRQARNDISRMVDDLVNSGVSQEKALAMSKIEHWLKSEYKYTTIAQDRSSILSSGTEVMIRKDGLVLFPVSASSGASNIYKKGRIAQGAFGRGKALMLGVTLPIGDPNGIAGRVLSDEKLWITDIYTQEDGIVFKLFHEDRAGVCYYGDLRIAFTVKREIPSVDAAKLLVDEVLTVIHSD